MIVLSALEYAGLHGFAVFQIVPETKRPPKNPPGTPIGRGGFYLATKDPIEINRMWHERPTHEIGIRCGSASSLVVVDCDDAFSVGWFRAFVDCEPNVFTKRGAHWYFRMARKTRSTKHRMGAEHGCKIDIQSDGSYVVAPPSAGRTVSPRGLEPYPWPAVLDETEITKPVVEPPPPPPEWKRKVRVGGEPGKWGEAVIGNACNKVMTAGKGSRNATIWAQGFMIGGYVAGEPVDVPYLASRDRLMEAARAGGYEKKDIERIIPAIRAGMMKPLFKKESGRR